MIGGRHFAERASRRRAHLVAARLRSRSDHGRRRQMAAGDTTVGSTPSNENQPGVGKCHNTDAPSVAGPSRS